MQKLTFPQDSIDRLLEEFVTQNYDPRRVCRAVFRKTESKESVGHILCGLPIIMHERGGTIDTASFETLVLNRSFRSKDSNFVDGFVKIYGSINCGLCIPQFGLPPIECIGKVNGSPYTFVEYVPMNLLSWMQDWSPLERYGGQTFDAVIFQLVCSLRDARAKNLAYEAVNSTNLFVKENNTTVRVGGKYYEFQFSPKILAEAWEAEGEELEDTETTVSNLLNHLSSGPVTPFTKERLQKLRGLYLTDLEGTLAAFEEKSKHLLAAEPSYETYFIACHEDNMLSSKIKKARDYNLASFGKEIDSYEDALAGWLRVLKQRESEQPLIEDR